jgi:hypothetical protein
MNSEDDGVFTLGEIGRKLTEALEWSPGGSRSIIVQTRRKQLLICNKRDLFRRSQ